MKILIYGLGKEGLLARKAIRKEHTIIGFTDSFANIGNYDNCVFYNRKKLKEINFDYMILALSNRKVSEKVKEQLILEGVRPEKIIDFRQLFTWQKVDKVMYSSKGEKIDGIILGLSHALFGINPTYLPGKWKNLATSGEDLYCHYKVLRKCVDCYSDVISNLKYAIIDLYDYSVFNYDLSLSKNMLVYLSAGGYAEDLHHFSENKNYVGNIEEEMKNAGIYFPIIEESEFRLADRVFDINVIMQEMEYISMSENIGFRDYPLQLKHDKIIPEEPMLPYHLFYMGEERYPQTIEENKSVLKETIKLLKEINSKLKMFFLLIPRFGKMEKYHAHLLKHEYTEFNKIMSEFLEEDNCYYFDFKQCTQISSNRYFFWDAAHLNYMGAIAFTEILNSRIKEKL